MSSEFFQKNIIKIDSNNQFEFNKPLNLMTIVEQLDWFRSRIITIINAAQYHTSNSFIKFKISIETFQKKIKEDIEKDPHVIHVWHVCFFQIMEFFSSSESFKKLCTSLYQFADLNEKMFQSSLRTPFIYMFISSISSMLDKKVIEYKTLKNLCGYFINSYKEGNTNAYFKFEFESMNTIIQIPYSIQYTLYDLMIKCLIVIPGNYNLQIVSPGNKNYILNYNSKNVFLKDLFKLNEINKLKLNFVFERKKLLDTSDSDSSSTSRSNTHSNPVKEISIQYDEFYCQTSQLINPLEGIVLNRFILNSNSRIRDFTTLLRKKLIEDEIIPTSWHLHLFMPKFKTDVALYEQDYLPLIKGAIRFKNLSHSNEMKLVYVVSQEPAYFMDFCIYQCQINNAKILIIPSNSKFSEPYFMMTELLFSFTNLTVNKIITKTEDRENFLKDKTPITRFTVSFLTYFTEKVCLGEFNQVKETILKNIRKTFFTEFSFNISAGLISALRASCKDIREFSTNCDQKTLPIGKYISFNTKIPHLPKVPDQAIYNTLQEFNSFNKDIVLHTKKENKNTHSNVEMYDLDSEEKLLSEKEISDLINLKFIPLLDKTMKIIKEECNVEMEEADNFLLTENTKNIDLTFLLSLIKTSDDGAFNYQLDEIFQGNNLELIRALKTLHELYFNKFIWVKQQADYKQITALENCFETSFLITGTTLKSFQIIIEEKIKSNFIAGDHAKEINHSLNPAWKPQLGELLPELSPEQFNSLHEYIKTEICSNLTNFQILLQKFGLTFDDLKDISEKESKILGDFIQFADSAFQSIHQLINQFPWSTLLRLNDNGRSLAIPYAEGIVTIIKAKYMHRNVLLKLEPGIIKELTYSQKAFHLMKTDRFWITFLLGLNKEILHYVINNPYQILKLVEDLRIKWKYFSQLTLDNINQLVTNHEKFKVLIDKGFPTLFLLRNLQLLSDPENYKKIHVIAISDFSMSNLPISLNFEELFECNFNEVIIFLKEFNLSWDDFLNVANINIAPRKYLNEGNRFTNLMQLSLTLKYDLFKFIKNNEDSELYNLNKFLIYYAPELTKLITETNFEFSYLISLLYPDNFRNLFVCNDFRELFAKQDFKRNLKPLILIGITRVVALFENHGKVVELKNLIGLKNCMQIKPKLFHFLLNRINSVNFLLANLMSGDEFIKLDESLLVEFVNKYSTVINLVVHLKIDLEILLIPSLLRKKLFETGDFIYSALRQVKIDSFSLSSILFDNPKHIPNESKKLKNQKEEIINSLNLEKEEYEKLVEKNKESIGIDSSKDNKKSPFELYQEKIVHYEKKLKENKIKIESLEESLYPAFIKLNQFLDNLKELKSNIELKEYLKNLSESNRSEKKIGFTQGTKT